MQAIKHFERFGVTLVFLFAILIFVIGAQMLLHISVPFIRGIDHSLADAIETTV